MYWKVLIHLCNGYSCLSINCIVELLCGRSGGFPKLPLACSVFHCLAQNNGINYGSRLLELKVVAVKLN